MSASRSAAVALAASVFATLALAGCHNAHSGAVGSSGSQTPPSAPPTPSAATPTASAPPTPAPSTSGGTGAVDAQGHVGGIAVTISGLPTPLRMSLGAQPQAFTLTLHNTA